MAFLLRANYGQVPPIFTHYQSFEGYFYTETLTKFSKLSRKVIQHVCLADIQEGKLRFKKFADNGFKQDYNHTGFRAVYCEKLFVTRAEIICDVLFIYESQTWLPHLLFDYSGRPRSLKVVSLGCGPAGELAGLEAYFTDLKIRHIKDLQANMCYAKYSSMLQAIQSAKLETVTGYDSAEGWKEYSECLGYQFVHCSVDPDFVKNMEPADILILSYFAHNSGGFSEPIKPLKYIWEINDFMRNWDILQQKVRMIILIDTSASSWQTLEQLSKRGFGRIDGRTDSQGRLLTIRMWFRPDMWVT